MIEEMPQGEFYADIRHGFERVDVLLIDHEDFDGNGLIYTLKTKDGTVKRWPRGEVVNLGKLMF